MGLHRFYLKGVRDWLGWALPLPSLLGAYGVMRVQQFGLDDRLSWILVPLLGFTIAACSLTAIIYGLMTPQEWNGRFNPSAHLSSPCGTTNWLTVGAILLSLLFGAAVLIASIAFSVQRYFEYQTKELPKLPSVA